MANIKQPLSTHIKCQKDGGKVYKILWQQFYYYPPYMYYKYPS